MFPTIFRLYKNFNKNNSSSNNNRQTNQKFPINICSHFDQIDFIKTARADCQLQQHFLEIKIQKSVKSFQINRINIGTQQYQNQQENCNNHQKSKKILLKLFQSHLSRTNHQQAYIYSKVKLLSMQDKRKTRKFRKIDKNIRYNLNNKRNKSHNRTTAATAINVILDNNQFRTTSHYHHHELKDCM